MSLKRSSGVMFVQVVWKVLIVQCKIYLEKETVHNGTLVMLSPDIAA